MIIAIDGATRRPGKPNCATAGAAFIKRQDSTSIKLSYEATGSTSQRGEISALVEALEAGRHEEFDEGDEVIMLITDSEYVFNTVGKNWILSWSSKGWVTALGEPVKNTDLWEHVGELLKGYAKETTITIIPYHIKGHLLKFNAKQAADLLGRDATGEFLYRSVLSKLTNEWDDMTEILAKAMETFERYHGYQVSDEVFRILIACNTTADLIAGWHIDSVEKR